MKKIFFALLAVLAGYGAAAQQLIKGEDIEDFTRVSFVGGMSVELIPADKPAVHMELHGVEPGQVTWNVTGGLLTVKVRPAQQKDGALLVKVSYRSLESISSNGADVIFRDTLRSEMLTVDATTGAKLSGVLDCRDLQLRLTGNSAAQLEGGCRYAILNANQRSRIDARQMETMCAGVQSLMASEIYTWATERLVAETNTGSAIFYRGEPPLLRVHNKLGGNVNSIGR